MAPDETPDEVRRWFLAEVAKLWPVAGGSLSLRKSPCIRERCSACESGEGHASYVLYTRTAGARHSHYVPDALAGECAQAVANGRRLQALLGEAGRRYLRARKATRR
jgi:hypothetical protein